MNSRGGLEIAPPCSWVYATLVTSMYLWRKHATTDWLREQSEALMARYGNNLAIVERPGKRALVEVVLKTRRKSTELQRDFAGKIENLPSDWLRQLMKEPPAKPLRIGSRLLV